MTFILAEKPVEKELNEKGFFSKSLKTETIAFIALTFGLTFLLNFVMWINYELIAERIELFSLALQLQMLLPAFSAIVLTLFVFKSKLFSRKPRILFYYFLILTALYALTFALWLINPVDIASIQLGSIENLGLTVLMGLLSLLTTLLTFGWIGLVFFWNLKSDSRKELEAAKLSFGKPSYYLLFSLFFFGYFLLSTILNWGFNLGSPPAEQAGLGTLLLGFAAIFYGSIAGLAQLFGEEYGWRIFLQNRLSQQYGRIKSVLLVGLVWGLWHTPLVVGAGWTFPGYPVLGVILFTILSILLSIPLGLAVFKSKSVWLAAFVHGVINYSANYLALNFYMPTDAVYSFGIGIYGLLVLGVIALVFLKSKEWKKRED